MNYKIIYYTRQKKEKMNKDVGLQGKSINGELNMNRERKHMLK